jgi:RNA polymerase sigma-70 factor (ECF subfamily)
MGLSVHALERDVGIDVHKLPVEPTLQDHDGDIEVDSLSYQDAGGPQINSAERDRLFAEMAERQGRVLFRIAFGLLRNVQDAEDAVQEALLKLYRGDGWLRMENEKAFLARTVWRAGLDLIQQRPKATEPLDDEAGREFAVPGSSAEQFAVDEDERTLLRRLIEGLPELLRQPLVLSAIDEMTSREVAIAIGIPEGTVRTRVMRARAELRRRFEAMRISDAKRKGERP